MLTLLLVLVILIYIIYYLLTRNNTHWKKRNVPGPAPMPFFGNLKESTLRRTTQGEILRSIYNQYGNEKVVGIYRMKTPSLLLRDLDVIKAVMIKDFDHFMSRGVEFDEDGLGANLFHADGEKWQVLRNKFTPLFTSGKLKNMFYLMTERCYKFIEYVKNTSPVKTEYNMYPLIQKYTMSVISACAFGLDLDVTDTKMIDELTEINNLMFRHNRTLEVDFMFPGILRRISSSIFPKKVKKYFTELTSNIIKQRDGKPTDRKDFMDLILELRQQKQLQGQKWKYEESLNLDLTDDIIAAQAFIFYAAGYETSATTVAFMLYELAKNPDLQDKLIEEVDSVMKKTNGEVTYESLSDMTYLTKVFDETLRLYPVVEPLQRVAKSNYKIPGTDVIVEKGQFVIMTALGIHHDEQYYPDPEKFDPERFSPENSGNRHSCAYVPFGLGPRNCIGMRFAKLQSRVCMTKLLSHFRVEPSKRTKEIVFDPNYAFTSPLGGLYLNLVPRVK